MTAGHAYRDAWERVCRGAGATAMSALAPLAVGLLPLRVLSPLRRQALDPRPPFDGDPSAGAVHRLAGLPWRRLWLVTGHAEARAVLADQLSFSNDFANLHGRRLPLGDPGGLGFSDPPDHIRLRRLLTPEFTRASLAAFEPRIAEIVSGQLQSLAERRSPADLWRDFALPVATRTICELLGLPEEDWADYQRLSTARFDLGRGAGAALGAVSSALAKLTDVVRTQPRVAG